MSTTVEAHFLQQHNRRLQYPEIFGVRLSKTAVFPAEVCVVVPGQLYKKKLSPDDTTTFLRFATQKPEERLRLIRESVAGHNQIFDYHKSDFMQDAGMVVNPQPIQIRGRVLPTPQILYGQGQMNIKQKTGAWNVVGQQLVSPSRIKSWAIVVFDQSTELFAIQQFITKLTKNLKNLGVDQPKPHIEKGNAHNPQESLNKAGKKAVENMPPNTRPNLILVVLPSSAAALRKVVKQWGDVLCAIPTQCVRQGKWEQGSDQYCNNVALKINAKIGGVNSAIKSPVMSFLADAMVVGTDVGHPGPGVSSRPSITSLVASVDPYATRYAAYANVQSPRQEIIEELGNMFKKALKDYFDFQQGKLPSKIIFYRDGVSEGEYAQVAKVEVEAIECALREIPMFANPQVSKPKIVFIIVGKRHHIRFFPSSREAADSSGNCPSGFVVDDQITNSMYLDFYLQSHSGIIGTSRPSHYVVLRDELNMTADQLQELSFALCHVYASATRSVSIPAPVYYADRVCARAEFHFRPDLNFGESEVATTASGDAPLFDLDKWKQGFRESALNKRMYFL
ncbi:hypothetical protein AcV5_006280 [Taiwanofungus camphoratus]|nr:hypothetical protein AcV5_006280 [Antrodia cinnamomea]